VKGRGWADVVTGYVPPNAYTTSSVIILVYRASGLSSLKR
jgi:hypothetical protein